MKSTWKYFISILLFCIFCTYATACSNELKPDISPNGSLAVKELSPEEKVDKILSTMTDSQKIGQLIMISINGPTLDADARYMMTEFPCGNVILFDRNMNTPEQVTKLNKDIFKTIFAQSKIPPFIAIDQEGGMVMRMENYMPALPSAEKVGTESIESAKNLSIQTGKALKSMKFNLNFAPVVDLDAAYHRSYGKTPETVISFAKTVIECYRSTGIKTTLKHFPGIGKVKVDPHFDGDTVNLTHEELNQEDGRPFKELIAQTDPNETFIMVSNVTFPALDPSNPACISKIIMTDLLQTEYGYEGIILTDDMEMGAMSKHYSFAEMGVKAISAGADLILVCQDYSHAQEVFNGLLKAYRLGLLDHNLIDSKVKKILLAKQNLT